MWAGNKIYFVSDRDENKKLNLYVYDLGTQQTQKLTDFTEFDVKFPSLGDHAIVFENGGEIYRYDLTGGPAQPLVISVGEDFAIGRGGLRDVSKEVTNFEISPDGNRALLGARGDVFTVPVKYGEHQEPDGHTRGARTEFQVVARRQGDRLYLGCLR